MKPLQLSLLFLFYFCLLSSQAQPQRLLIEDVSIIPMHINTILEHRDVIIENGKIVQIRPHTNQDSSQYKLGNIDGRGKFLVPSFSDAHVHLPSNKHLKRFFLMNLINGVSTLRSMRGETWHLDIDPKDEFTPRLFLASPPISRQDSLSPLQINQLVSKYKKEGFDFIKVLSVKDQRTLDCLVGASSQYKLPLAGHCPSNSSIFNVSNSGVFQSIEHLGGFFSFRDLESIQLAIDQTIQANLYHCPTLDWYYTGQIKASELRKRAGVEFLPQEWIDKWEKKISDHHTETSAAGRAQERELNKQRFDTRLMYLGFIYAQGGKLLLSSDASGIYGIPGYSLHTEMQHYQNAKISNYDILKSTCYNLATLFEEQQNWGTIKVGCHSDMVLLQANPLEDIQNTQKIEGIIFKGNYYRQADLKQQLKELKD